MNFIFWIGTFFCAFRTVPTFILHNPPRIMLGGPRLFTGVQDRLTYYDSNCVVLQNYNIAKLTEFDWYIQLRVLDDSTIRGYTNLFTVKVNTFTNCFILARSSERIL